MVGGDNFHNKGCSAGAAEKETLILYSLFLQLRYIYGEVSLVIFLSERVISGCFCLRRQTVGRLEPGGDDYACVRTVKHGYKRDPGLNK